MIRLAGRDHDRLTLVNIRSLITVGSVAPLTSTVTNRSESEVTTMRTRSPTGVYEPALKGEAFESEVGIVGDFGAGTGIREC